MQITFFVKIKFKIKDLKIRRYKDYISGNEI